MHSPTIAKIAEALSKAQAVFKPAIKESANPFFKSRYVDLAGALDAIREALAKNGLAIIQTTEISPTGLVLHSQLIHSSGEWLSSTYPIKPIKEDPQGYGSAMTYARRYSLMALVGIAAEDDDGEAASGRQSAPAKVASVTGQILKAKPKWSPEEQKKVGVIFADIFRLGGKTGEDDVARIRHDMGYDTPENVIHAAEARLLYWQGIAAENGVAQ